MTNIEKIKTKVTNKFILTLYRIGAVRFLFYDIYDQYAEVSKHNIYESQTYPSYKVKMVLWHPVTILLFLILISILWLTAIIMEGISSVKGSYGELFRIFFKPEKINF